MLQIEQQVESEMLNIRLLVKKKLGEGGQGTVYLVEGKDGLHAMKWYNPEQSTEDQKTAIRYLVQTGPPRGFSSQRFIWPLDIVSIRGMLQFGYLMPLIDTQKFAELGEVWAHIKPAPGFSALCEISYQGANSYRALHLSGHCYRDISAGNLMFNPLSGDVLICDNDNVGVNRHSNCQVWGTMEYMAPEIIRGEAHPSTETDLHSLAVLLFYMWVWHHPMHGEIEYKFHCWDIPAKKRVYGTSPIFIFDPTDKSNQLPQDSEYSTARKRWGMCPKSLQKTFTQSFTVGLKEPARRVTEGEWQGLFLQLKDGTITCPHDKAENIWENGATTLNCWYCKKPIPLPPKLVLTNVAGKHFLLLTKEAKILKRHVNPAIREEDATTVIGQVAQNPNNLQVWGIRNLSDTAWKVTFPDGGTKEILPQKAVPLNAGLKIVINGCAAEVVL